MNEHPRPADPPSGPTPNLGYGVTWPSLDEFTEMARSRRVIPVVRRLLADAETPVGVYRKLAKDASGTFLLESAEHGGVWSRYSIVGAACSAVLTEKDGMPRLPAADIRLQRAKSLSRAGALLADHLAGELSAPV